MIKIVADPGHGGKDPGAVGNDLIEKYLNWKMANKIKDIMGQYEVDFIIVQPSTINPDSSGSDELYLPPEEAIKLKADFYLSLHVNAGGGTGFESYVHTDAKNNKADTLRAIIHNQVAEYLGSFSITDRGKKYANFAVLRLTNNAGIPSVLLENLFLDNQKDANLLKSDSFLDGLAGAIAYGLVLAFNLNKKATKPKVIVNDVVLDGMFVGDRVFAPVRALSEALGHTVEWDGKTQTVTVK